MTLKISIEDLENYLKNHAVLFGSLLLLTISIILRYILFDLGLYFWGSYFLLEVVLLLVTVRFAESVNGTAPFRPFMTLSVAILLPFIVTGFDQLYLNTILRYTHPICMSLPFLYTTAEWLASPNGGSYLATTLSTTSEATLVALVFEVVCIFLLSRIFGKRHDKNNLVTA